MKKCINCSWTGEECKIDGVYRHCPVCGNNAVDILPLTPKLDPLDINKDGKVDAKDVADLKKVVETKKKGK